MAKNTQPKKATIEALLNAHLAEAGLSQGAFAKAHGLSKSTVQFIASGGGGTVSLENARILAPILGRSVAELVGLDESEAGGNAGIGDPAIRLIPHRLIIRSDINPRKAFDEESIAELADSIVENGVLQNLIVREYEANGPGKGKTKLVSTGEQLWELVGGERRHRAVDLAIRDGRLHKDYAVPCRPTEGPEAQIRAIALLENLQRQDLSPLEEADAFHILTAQYGWTTAQIAERIHKTQRFVQQRVALVTKLAPEIRTALSDGTIKFDQARALTTAEPKQQLKMLKDIEVNDYGLKTGDDIRKRLTRGKVPASYAIFPITKYTGDTLTDDDDNVYFSDRKEFDKLQKEAVEELRQDKLGEGWAFVIVDHLYAGDYVEERSANRKKSGVVIELDWRGQVTVYEGVVPELSIKAFLKQRAEMEAEDKDDETETNEERNARWDKERAERAAEEKARQEYLGQVNPRIRAAMEATPALMLHYALWDCQANARHRQNAPELLTWEQIVALSLEEAAVRMAHIELFTNFRDSNGPFSIHDEQNDGVRALFAAISEPTPAWMEEEREEEEEDLDDDDQDDDADDADSSGSGDDELHDGADGSDTDGVRDTDGDAHAERAA